MLIGWLVVAGVVLMAGLIVADDVAAIECRPDPIGEA